MPKSLKNRSERERPDLPETQYLCASCRYGVVLLSKVTLGDPFDPTDEPWKSKERYVWMWQARCNSPRVAGRWPEMFCNPVVDCEGFEARDLDGPKPEPTEETDAEAS